MKVAIATRALAGEDTCGDLGRWWRRGRDSLLCLVDGLGHGPEAAMAAKTVLDHLATCDEPDIKALFTACDRAARHTRGVAMAVAMIETAPTRLTYAAVGNIRAALLGDTARPLASDAGIVGAGFRRLEPYQCPWADGDLLVLWTDGLPTSLPLATLPAGLRFAPDALAAWLIDCHASGTDDAGVLVARLDASHDLATP